MLNKPSEKYERWPSLRLFDALGVPYLVFKARPAPASTDDIVYALRADWPGPLWTGSQMILDGGDRYGDAGYFHELCHWLVASPDQRKVPDFGLDRVTNSDLELFASSTTTTVYVNDRDYAQRGWGETCVPREEAGRQENLACAALALYEPLVGHWDWSYRPASSELNEALGDYNGGTQLSQLLKPETVRRLYDEIVAPLAPVPIDVVADYCAHVRALD